MARVLLSSFGSYGDVHPVLGLAAALRRRGHEPVLALPEFYRADVEREGLELRTVRPDLDLEDREMVRRVLHPVTGVRYLFREVVAASVRDSYRDLHAATADADLVITHPAAPAGTLAAEARGLPWLSIALAPLTLFSARDPMVPPVAPWAHALTARWEALARASLWVADRVSRSWARPVLRLRRELGLPDRGNPIMQAQHSPLGVLGLFSRVLARPQADWPDRVHVTGAVLYNGRAGMPAMTPELEAFLDAGDPPLVFTLGSSAGHAAGSFYRDAADAARRLGRRAVLLVGSDPRDSPDSAVAGGDDRIAVPWADHAALFPRVAAIVHQGGAGTLHQALLAGRPQLIVPHGYDQYDNAARAARLGLARVMTTRRFGARRAALELDRILEDPRFAARAEDGAATVAAERGADAACDCVEDTLAAG